jgi:hypothetical protein
MSGLVSSPIIVMALLCFAQIGVGTGDVLTAAGELPDWSVIRCWDFGDQFAGQSVRVRRSPLRWAI